MRDYLRASALHRMGHEVAARAALSACFEREPAFRHEAALDPRLRRLLSLDAVGEFV
jgi:hypothetical protein